MTNTENKDNKVEDMELAVVGRGSTRSNGITERRKNAQYTRG